MNLITIDDVRRRAPAAFTNSPVSSLTDSYAHVTTAHVLDALQQDGWQITTAAQRRARSSVTGEHGRHEIGLTHPELPTHAEGAPVLRLSNSSDGGHAFRLIGGFLRWACTNQLYAGIKCVGGVFHHRGGSLEDRIVAGAREARANFDRVIRRVDLWRQIELSWEQQVDFVAAAVAARWPGDNAPSVSPNEILAPRRLEDQGRSLWTTFNQAQESLIRGGFVANFRVYDPQEGQFEGWERRRVRRITGITANERINTALWNHAEEFASPFREIFAADAEPATITSAA